MIGFISISDGLGIKANESKQDSLTFPCCLTGDTSDLALHKQGYEVPTEVLNVKGGRKRGLVSFELAGIDGITCAPCLSRAVCIDRSQRWVSRWVRKGGKINWPSLHLGLGGVGRAPVDCWGEGSGERAGAGALGGCWALRWSPGGKKM